MRTYFVTFTFCNGNDVKSYCRSFSSRKSMNKYIRDFISSKISSENTIIDEYVQIWIRELVHSESICLYQGDSFDETFFS